MPFGAGPGERELQKYDSKELQTPIDYSQTGEVFISSTIGLIHLLTKQDGAIRLITLTKIRLYDLTMRGTVLTQAQGEFAYQPSVSPILMRKCDPSLTPHVLAGQVGPIRHGDEEYDRVNQALSEVERKVSIFALTPQLPGGDNVQTLAVRTVKR